MRISESGGAKNSLVFGLLGKLFGGVRKKQYFCIGFVNIAITMKKKVIKIIISVAIAALTALGAALGLSSCNVVRTITNKSEYYQRGDTSVMIQTKTTESYDATKKL